MVKARIHWIDGIHWVFVDCLESIVVQIYLEISLFGVINQQFQLLSLFFLLFFVLSSPFFHSFLLLLKRRHLFFFSFLWLLILCIKATFESDLDIIFGFSVFFVAGLSPITKINVILSLVDDLLDSVFLFDILFIDVHAPVHLIKLFLSESAPILFF
jgi:hypothetical protein